MSFTASKSGEKTDVSWFYVLEGVVQQSIRVVDWT